MKFTIICHLAPFLFINSPRQKGSQMTNNREFHVLLLIFWNMKFVTGHGWKQISWSNLTLQTVASYIVSSVVLQFSMLGLGHILISNLVVANLLMCSLPGMILLYLTAPFLHQRCFWIRLPFTQCYPSVNSFIVLAIFCSCVQWVFYVQERY